MIETPILSIVIPTYNRYKTLIPVIENILNWNFNDFELIIHDNSLDNQQFNDILVKYKNDHRLKYFHFSKKISAVENCDIAVSKANGYYVCFIGDDDGVTPEIIRICYWLKINQYESMCCNVPLYTWKDMEHSLSINNGFNGKLILKKFNGNYSNINSYSELQKLLKSGAQNLYQIPRLYQGIVSNKILQELKSKVNTYFPGPVPDMSNAVAISTLVNKHCYIDLPLIIAGHSKESMSGKNSRRLHQGEIISEKSLSDNTSTNWSNEIPFFWSAPTIWSEAAIKSLESLGLKTEIQKLNFSKIYSNCFVFCDYNYYNRIFKSMHYNRNIFSIFLIYLEVIININITIFKRAINFLKKRIIGIKGIDCNDIDIAIEECSLNINNIENSINI